MDLERGQCEPGLLSGVPRPPSCEATELPNSSADTPSRNEHGQGGELYVASLHNASFCERESRRRAASRFNALARSETASW